MVTPASSYSLSIPHPILLFTTFLFDLQRFKDVTAVHVRDIEYDRGIFEVVTLTQGIVNVKIPFFEFLHLMKCTKGSKRIKTW